MAINCAAIPENLLESPNCSATRRARSPAPPSRRMGKVETGQRRHLLPRRSGRPADAAAGQAAALPAGAGDRAHRRQRRDPGRRAHRLRDPPEPEGAGQRRPLPRGLVLPPVGNRHHHSAAARPHRRRGAAGASFQEPASAARKAASALHFSDEAMATIEAHPWPGNVREMENMHQARRHHGGRPADRRRGPRPGRLAGDRRAA